MTKPAFKTITTTIPSKYRYIATDFDGCICAFQFKPQLTKYFWRRNRGHIFQVGRGPKPKDFTKTLERI